MANITLEKADVQFFWTDKLLDATVIEISPELAARFRSYGAQFLRVGAATPNSNVVMLQFPSGEFKTINESQVVHQIGDGPGSSVSPQLNVDCEALAMHHTFSCEQSARGQNLWSELCNNGCFKERPDAVPEVEFKTGD